MSNLINVFNKAIKYIEEKIKNSEEILNKDGAEFCGYEQHYFSKIFQKYANMSIQEYVKRRRMSFAFGDLLSSKKNIADIAEKYLYSADGFTKAFKDIFGITPIQLKREEMGENLCDNFMNPMFIEDYSKYIDEPKYYNIRETEEMKFIGVSDIDLGADIQQLENEFEYLAIINKNGKRFELSYFIDEEEKYKSTIYANYYIPFGYYPEEFELINVPKQKWVVFRAEGIEKLFIISAIKSYFYNEWLKKHKEYERDDNYEIAFECYSDEWLDGNRSLSMCEVWFPIKEKK